jgi:hypothetical protein
MSNAVKEMQHRFKRHIQKKNELYVMFQSQLQNEIINMYPKEHMFINFNSNFAFSNSLNSFNLKIKKELFGILFNLQLFEFLSKRIDVILKPSKPVSIRKRQAHHQR